MHYRTGASGRPELVVKDTDRKRWRKWSEELERINQFGDEEAKPLAQRAASQLRMLAEHYEAEKVTAGPTE